MLLNILPEPIAKRLKDSTETIADGVEEVSVLFADIAQFTPFSSALSPLDVVRVLNRMFSAFDEIATRHGIEKIKTIGDAYMAAAGVPTHRREHLVAVAEMALDMQESMRTINLELGTNLDLRIGLNTGAVVAGVIGVKKFIYDLWGDSVNTASRMESHGVPGRIHTTEAVFKALNHRYLFECRGEIDVKGKGPMKTYFLVGRHDLGPAATP